MTSPDDELRNLPTYKTVQQISSSILRLELERIEAVSQQNVAEVLKEACLQLSKFLKEEQGKVLDFKDLLTFRLKVSLISYFVDLSMDSSPQRSSSWAEPLIRECYEICGISDQRTILIIHNHDTNVGEFNVIADVFSQFKSQNKDMFSEELSKKELDIFSIPAEAQFDLAFIALIAHEVGHVYWQQEKNKKKIEDQVKADFVNINGYESSEIQVTTLKNHIEEYLCDKVGSYLLGPAFDYSLLRLFGSIGNPASTHTHPSKNIRIHRSKVQLLQYATGDIELTASFNKLLAGVDCLELVAPKPEEGLDKIAIAVANTVYPQSRLKISERYNPERISDILKKVTPELNAFRPPFETVNKDWPVLITPVEALVASVIYFHTEQFGNNEFLLDDGKGDGEKKQRKIEVLRQKIIDHVHYSISLYGFVKSIRVKPSDTELTFIQEHTLWKERAVVKNKNKADFVVVPTTDPKPQYGQNSVDLRLGCTFLVSRPSRYTHIDPEPTNGSQPLQNHFEKIYVPIGENFILHPHQFVLASILEYISLPYDFYALILGRSTWGRLGLNIATATTVQAGYRGCLTLELRNLGESPLPLKIGIRIAQLCLINMPDTEILQGYDTYFNKGDGKYIGPVSVGAPRIHEDADWELLKRYKPPQAKKP